MLRSPSRSSLLSLSGLALTAAALAQQPPALPVTVDEVFGHVEFLASNEMNGRASGSAYGAIAGAYIAAEFRKLGLQPAGDEGTFFQGFQRIEIVVHKDELVDGKPKQQQFTLSCRNVLAWLPGSDAKLADEYVLIGAHYDHLGGNDEVMFPGADDNASGVAGLLGIARALATQPQKPRRSVLFVAFDAEEQGLAGAERFARNPPRSLQKLVAMINLDMIGRDRLLDRESMAMGKKMVGVPDAPACGVLGTASSPELAAAGRAAFAADQLPLFAPEDFGMLGGIIEQQAKGRSDHAPFERRKIPFLFFSTSENDDYHRPSDTIDKVDPQVLWRIAQGVYRTVLTIDAADARPTWVTKPGDEAESAEADAKQLRNK